MKYIKKLYNLGIFRYFFTITVVVAGIMTLLTHSRALTLNAAQSIIGSPISTIDINSISIDSFPDVYGVTQEYVDAYKLFLTSHQGGADKKNYTHSITAFEKIIVHTESPELRLRSLYFLSFCNFLNGEIKTSYQHSIELLKLAKELHADDSHTILASRLVRGIESGIIDISDVRILLAARGAVDESICIETLSSSVPARGLYPVNSSAEDHKP